MPALRDEKGKFLPREVAQRMLAYWTGTPDELQAEIKTRGAEAVQRDVEGADALPTATTEDGRVVPAFINEAAVTIDKPKAPDVKVYIGRKGSAFRRIVRTQYVEDGSAMGTLRYFHATKGWRKRRATEKLVLELRR